MKQNPPLTSEEAKNLTFPCLLEVWDYKNRTGHYVIISHITGKGSFVTTTGIEWHHAAVPSPEIAEAMRKQFGIQSEYPKRMLVWDYDESNAKERIVLADLGEKAQVGYIAVHPTYEHKFQNGQPFSWTCYAHAKPLPKGEDQLLEQLSELEKQLEIITQQINGIKTQIK